jgi:transcription elongation factor GreA
MSEQTVSKIRQLLNEEKWTRATLNSYTIGNFKELDTIIDETLQDSVQNEVKALCDEHLDHTKNSIIALYISGIISLSRQLVDDTNLIMLINIFTDNHKWNVVEYLCNRILAFGENKYALRTLAECYNNENKDDDMYAVWERLIRVDYEEADIVRHLAERKEEQGSIEEAVDYYKKAIHRYINKKLYSHVKDIWNKLKEHSPQEIDFFFHVENKIAKTISPERAGQLLEELYPYYKDQEDWDTAITILKRVLDYDGRNAWARKEIIECYRSKYQEHSQLDEYIRLSNLTQSWRNVHDAIGDFEKHISFDEGNFVFHRSWGIGIISKIRDDEIVIDFARKRGHKMSLKMAVNALSILSKDHIWVLKVIWKKDKLREKVKKDIPWALRTVIKSFDNGADMKRIKAELVPSVLAQNEWSSWSSEARKTLKTDPTFGTHPEKLDMFVVRENPISFAEKTFNTFQAERSFFGRLSAIEDFLSHADIDSEYFGEMFSYFTSFVKAFNTVNEQVVASYLLVQRVIASYPFLNPGLSYTFSELFEQIEDVEDVFSKLEAADLKREFLEQVKQHISTWPSIFVRLFPLYLSRYILDELIESGHKAEAQQLFLNIMDHYREYREAFVWLTRNVVDEEWFDELNVEYEKLLIGMIHLLDITFREIENRKDVSANRRVNKQIHSFLFKDSKLEQFIATADRDSLTRVYTLVSDVKDLDPSLKLELRHKVTERYPDFKFIGEAEKGTVSRGLIVSRGSYTEKQRQLQHILDVEVPASSKEISAALQHGDLRENAEYKAAKERQEMLNSSAARLKEDIERAQIFEKKDVDSSRISFGTKVRLYNKDSDASEEYVILGPWESNPSENVISYLSPLGNELWNHKKDENLSFVINERTYNYRVEEISVADF